jgi:hypothetical protein
VNQTNNFPHSFNLPLRELLRRPAEISRQ